MWQVMTTYGFAAAQSIRVLFSADLNELSQLAAWPDLFREFELDRKAECRELLLDFLELDIPAQTMIEAAAQTQFDEEDLARWHMIEEYERVEYILDNPNQLVEIAV